MSENNWKTKLREDTAYILDRIQKEIEFHAKHSKGLKRTAFGFRISTLVLAGISTIILGLKLGGDWDVLSKNIALVIGAVITVLSGISSFWNIEQYWKRNTSAMLRLIQLREQFVFLAKRPEGISPEEAEKIFKKLKSIKAEKIEYWQKATKKKVVSDNN